MDKILPLLPPPILLTYVTRYSVVITHHAPAYLCSGTSSSRPCHLTIPSTYQVGTSLADRSVALCMFMVITFTLRTPVCALATHTDYIQTYNVVKPSTPKLSKFNMMNLPFLMTSSLVDINVNSSHASACEVTRGGTLLVRWMGMDDDLYAIIVIYDCNMFLRH